MIEVTLMMPFHGKQTKNHYLLFRQKRLVATRNENWADGLYSSYCPFAQLSERPQMTAFHEKVTKKGYYRGFTSSLSKVSCICLMYRRLRRTISRHTNAHKATTAQTIAFTTAPLAALQIANGALNTKANAHTTYKNLSWFTMLFYAIYSYNVRGQQYLTKV